MNNVYVIIKKDGSVSRIVGEIKNNVLCYALSHRDGTVYKPIFSKVLCEKYSLLEKARKIELLKNCDTELLKCIYKLGKNEDESIVMTESEYLENKAKEECINFSCESLPHKEDLSGVILNSPTPKGGAFMTSNQIPAQLFSKIKNAGACRYYSQEDLEEFDMFYSEHGWRYSIQALKILLDNHIKVKIYNTEITNISEVIAIVEAYRKEQIEKEERFKKAEQERQEKIKREEDEDKNFFNDIFKKHTNTLEKSGYSWDSSVVDKNKELIAKRKHGEWGLLYKTKSLITSNDCYIHYFGNASILYADKETVEASWNKIWEGMTENRIGHCVHILSMIEFYANCAGIEYCKYAFSKHKDEIIKNAQSNIIYTIENTWRGIDTQEAKILAEKYNLETHELRYESGKYYKKDKVSRKTNESVEGIYTDKVSGKLVAKTYRGKFFEIENNDVEN